ncbi:MAG TPA: tetratricopeptide repeat protein [Polyangia bacterium]|nr:tetratricopeptide repeat protein [Polyangia bacterium]
MRWRGMVTALGIGLLSAQAARAELQAPRNVNVEPTTKQSSELASRAAAADMKGNAGQAVQLADQAIRSDPRNAWAYYDKGMALAEMGETDGAIAALYAAEQHFAAADRWGRSVAIYGRAHALSQAGRCTEAVQAFAEYATFVGKDDPQAAYMARRYAMDCKSPAGLSPPPNVPQPRR